MEITILKYLKNKDIKLFNLVRVDSVGCREMAGILVDFPESQQILI